MKYFRLVITMILSTGLFLSCGKESEESFYAAGTYSTQTIEWDQEIDLAGVEYPQKSILNQMNLCGWYGLQSIKRNGEETSPFYKNEITGSSDTDFSILLFLPFPYTNPNKNLEEPVQGKCHVYLDEYSLQCSLDDRGNVHILKASDEEFMRCPKVTIKEKTGNRVELLFEADTFYYDWTTGKYQDGHIRVTLLNNTSITITYHE